MNSVEMVGRLILALGAVLVIMWLLARFARRPLAGKSDRVVTVLARQQLNRNASVAVLKVLDRAFVVGVTDQGVNLLTETDLSSLEEALSNQGSKSPRTREISAGPESTSELPPAVLAASQPITAVASASLPLTSAPATGGHRAHRAHAPRAPREGKKSALDGSILSPKTWSALVNVARDVTVRR